MNGQSDFKQAFTLIEVLVVIAIIGILAAIIFPVLSHVREKGRQAKCLSNERQIGMAILLYAQDSDETYPWSYGPGPNWRTNVSSYLAQPPQGGILLCPDSPADDTELGYSTNAQVIGPIGSPDQGENFYQFTVPMNQVADPTSTVLLGDAITDQTGNISPGPRVADEYAYPHPALIKDHTNDLTWAIDWVVPQTDGYNNKQIAWLHSGGANFVFCDGHAKWEQREQLTDANWDVRCTPGVGCTGHSYPPNPADYPAISPACGNESALDCD